MHLLHTRTYAQLLSFGSINHGQPTPVNIICQQQTGSYHSYPSTTNSIHSDRKLQARLVLYPLLTLLTFFLSTVPTTYMCSNPKWHKITKRRVRTNYPLTTTDLKKDAWLSASLMSQPEMSFSHKGRAAQKKKSNRGNNETPPEPRRPAENAEEREMNVAERKSYRHFDFEHTQYNIHIRI